MAIAEFPEPVYSVLGKAHVFVGYDNRTGLLEHIRGVNDTEFRLQINCIITVSGRTFSWVFEPFSSPPAIGVPGDFKTLDPWKDCMWSGFEVQR